MSLPANQYVSAVVESIDLANGPGLELFARANISGDNIFGYKLVYIGPDYFYLFNSQTGATLITLPSTTVSAGDTLTLACVGSQISVLYNGTIIGQGTSSSFASGSTFLGMEPDNLTDLQISNYTVGSAAASSGGSGRFSGSVVEVGSVPSGKTNPFLGTFKVVTQAPGGQAVGQASETLTLGTS